jgi:polysaccharide export outer membrane protein
MSATRYACFLFVIIFGCAFFVLDGSNQAFAQEPKEKAEYKIDVGDVLDINVWKEEDFTREVFVRLDGRISLPLVGDVMAAGNTPMELAKSLEEKIGEIVAEPAVTVLLKSSASRVYYMVGNINNPGAFPINTPINLLQAIARAGGMGEWAEKDEIIVVRRSAGKDEMLTFDYEKFVKGKDLSQNIMLRYGDTVIVP